MKLLLLALILQQKLITQKEAVTAAKAEAAKWNKDAWLASIEALGAGDKSVDVPGGRWLGWKVFFAVKGANPGELDTCTWETFDGGATWKEGDKKTFKESYGWMALPDKLAADARLAVDIVKKNGVKTPQPSVKLSIERGWPIWRSITDGEPIVVIDAVSGKGIGIVKTTLNDLLDRGGKGAPWTEASAAVKAALTDWGVTEYGLVLVEGRSLGTADLSKALHLQAWKILVESAKPAVRVEFTYHNNRISGWSAYSQPTGEKTTPPGEIDLNKAGGYVAGHPLVVDWAKNKKGFNIELVIDPDRIARKELKVRVIEEGKSDSWAQMILDSTTGKVKDFIKQ